MAPRPAAAAASRCPAGLAPMGQAAVLIDAGQEPGILCQPASRCVASPDPVCPSLCRLGARARNVLTCTPPPCRAAFIPFLVACDPDAGTTVQALKTLDEVGGWVQGEAGGCSLRLRVGEYPACVRPACVVAGAGTAPRCICARCPTEAAALHLCCVHAAVSLCCVRLLQPAGRCRCTGAALHALLVLFCRHLLLLTPPAACCTVQIGADVIELGVPYSDPLADGPTIQAAATRALQKGTTLDKVGRCCMAGGACWFGCCWVGCCTSAACAGNVAAPLQKQTRSRSGSPRAPHRPQAAPVPCPPCPPCPCPAPALPPGAGRGARGERGHQSPDCHVHLLQPNHGARPGQVLPAGQGGGRVGCVHGRGRGGRGVGARGWPLGPAGGVGAH